MNTDYYKFCLGTYRKEYDRRHHSLLRKHQGKAITETMADNFDREAQKYAIRQSFTRALTQFPEVSVAELWNAIYRSHLFRKSGISDLTTISKVISADQSWKKSSGHAFEEMVKDLASLALSGTGIDVVLQRDLNTLVKASELANEPRDISWLRNRLRLTFSTSISCSQSMDGATASDVYRQRPASETA